MTTREEQIKEELAELQQKRNSIAYQVDEAMMIARERNEWVEATWLSKAKHAMRITGRQIGILQRELGEINATKKKENLKKSEERGEKFERQFLYNAKLILPQVLYEEILYKTLNEVPHDEAN